VISMVYKPIKTTQWKTQKKKPPRWLQDSRGDESDDGAGVLGHFMGICLV